MKMDFGKTGPAEFEYTIKDNLKCRVVYRPKLPKVERNTDFEQPEFKELKIRLKRLDLGLEELIPEIIPRITSLIEKLEMYGREQLKRERDQKVISLKERSYEGFLTEVGTFPEENIVYTFSIENLTNDKQKMLALKIGIDAAYEFVKKEMYSIMKKLEETGEKKRSEKIIDVTEHPKFKEKINYNQDSEERF